MTMLASIVMASALSASAAPLNVAGDAGKGVTREEVIAKLGVPDATRSLGLGREDLYYCRQVSLRVTLKDGLMVEGVIARDSAQQPAVCRRKTLA